MPDAMILTLADGATAERSSVHDTLRAIAGVRDVTWSDDAHVLDAGPVAPTGVHVLAHLGLVIADVDTDQAEALARHSRERHALVLAVEPELVLRAIPAAPVATHDPAAVDTAPVTWGVAAVGASATSATGEGVRICVLDTGVAPGHPDLAHRIARSQSFVPGAAVDDGNGHGTHCCGTACGPAVSQFGVRYGVAPGAELWVAKVLGDDGSGADRQILAGLDWAVGQGADVASMSLGADLPTPRIAYERAGGRALRQGTLIVAAAGNNADRVHGDVGFVGVPANSTSILAVGAVDRDLRVANFSARGNAGDGGRIDVVAPGVDVRSAWPAAPGWEVLSGTSMATPHVAGVAALLAQTTGHRGKELWGDVTRLARVVAAASPLDIGAGLAHVDPS